MPRNATMGVALITGSAVLFWAAWFTKPPVFGRLPAVIASKDDGGGTTTPTDVAFIRPVNGAVTRDFFFESDLYVGGMHAATDFAAGTGTPVKVMASGIVISKAWDTVHGHFVGVQHADGWQSYYRHLYQQTPVRVGQQVEQGQTIGIVGSTGISEGPHLHVDLWNDVKRDDTAFYKHGIWAHNLERYIGS